MITVYFARHAEASNPRGILYGRLPKVDLSSTGRQQAARLASALRDVPIETVYTSPLLRARRTAGLLVATRPQVPLRISALLLENRHPYEGRPHADVTALGDHVYDPDVLGEAGETIEQIQARMVRFLRMTSHRHPGFVIAAVGHADPLAALRTYLLGKPAVVASLRGEAPPPASVFKVEYRPGGETTLEWVWKPAAAAGQETAQAGPGAAEGGRSAA